MAIYHLTVKNISRNDGRSAVASAAYRRALCLFDERLQQGQDYSHKPDVIHRELAVPPNAPVWANDLKALDEHDPQQAAEKLWNLVEQTEKRTDARLAKEIEFALPIELTQAQSIALAREFIQDQCAGLGMLADWSVHWDNGNPHVHVMLTTRALTETGFGLKVRDWNHEKLVHDWRLSWAEYANFHLALHQHDVRIDHRSYDAQGIDLVPGIHHGRAAIEMEQNGKPTAIFQEAALINAANVERIKQRPEVILDKVASERSTFNDEDIASQLKRYIPSSQSAASGAASTTSPEEILEKATQRESEISSPLAERDATLRETLQRIEHFDSVFGEREMKKALLENAANRDEFEQLLVQLKRSKELIPLGMGDDGRERFTTRRMLALENTIQTLSDRLRDRRHKVITLKAQRQVLAALQKRMGKVLTAEQTQAIQHLCDKTAITCLVGRAGTGKSFTLGAAREVWESAGMTVYGVALSGIAADGLTKDAGMQSRTIESFKLALQNQQICLDKHAVVVMDEAGMTDSVSMYAILSAVETAGAKLVLVGDPAQLQPVGAGASFRALLERVGYAELQQVYRQKEAWAAKATQAFSKGQVDKALHAYEQKGYIHWLPEASDAKQKCVADWQAMRTETAKPLQEFLIIAHRNDDVSALNQLARDVRIQQGELASGHGIKTHCGEIELSPGDRLLFLKNDRQLGVSNGRFATVKQFELSEGGQVLGITVILDGEAGQHVTFNPREYQHFMLGYAATVHKVQGLTVDHAFTYAGGKGWNRHLTYVAKTRHRYTSHLYADATTHGSLAQLKKNLGRFALKDSVLDYPHGFSVRRGLVIGSLAGHFKAHLTTRLQRVKKTLADAYEAILNPDKAAQRKKETLTAYLEQEAIQQRRQDAVTVANYVDANRACGQAWQNFQEQCQHVGLEPSGVLKETALLKRTVAHQTLKTAQERRNELAAVIMKTPSRYERAIEVCHLDLAKLQREAKQYGYQANVKCYLNEMKQGRIIHRDRWAALIYQAIKAHYPALIDNDVDMQQLKKSAHAHEQRCFLATLDSNERTYFKDVAYYQRLNSTLYDLKKSSYCVVATDEASSVLMTSRSVWGKIQALSKTRNALAYQIYQNEPLYQKALDFYAIGTVNTTVNHLEMADKIKRSNQRWYQLQNYAMHAAFSQRIEGYQDALLNGDRQQRQTLAHQMMQDIKAHHPAVLIHAVSPSALWRVIRDDHAAFEREQKIRALDPAMQADVKKVQAYLAEKQTVQQLWQEGFAANRMGTEKQPYWDTIQPYLNAHRPILDELAAELANDPTRYRVALALYDVDPATLIQAAERHACTERVKHYAQVYTGTQTHDSDSAFLMRARLAAEIMQQPKRHQEALQSAAIDWSTLYRDAKAYADYDLWQGLSQEERKLYRLARRYQQLNRHVGRLGARLAKQPALKTASKAKTSLTLLKAKRDYLAHQVMEQSETLKWALVFKQAEKAEPITHSVTVLNRLSLDWKMIQAQVQCHQEKVHTVSAWHVLEQRSQQGLKRLINTVSIKEKPERYLDWLAQQDEIALAELPLVQTPASYRYALQGIGLNSAASIADKTALKAQIKRILSQRHLPTVVRTSTKFNTDQRRRIKTARHLAKQTQPIQGTLAERYLREHRGITGTLPNTYRFHPNIYCAEIKQYLPALVVLAHNQKQRIQAVQITYLDPITANKARIRQPRLTYGVLHQAAVNVQSGKAGQPIALAEGAETALSIKEASPELTVYATLGAANFIRVPVQNAQAILICADNDGLNAASEEQVLKAADYFAKQGTTVYLAKPDFRDQKADFNDVLKAEGKAKVRDYLDKAQLLRAAEIIVSSEKMVVDLAKQWAASSQQPLNKTQTTIMPVSLYWEQLIQESQPIQGTLAETYFNEHCGLRGELSRHLHYHPAVPHPDTQKTYPAVISHLMGRDAKAKGVHVVYLDPQTGTKISNAADERLVQCPEEKAYIPIQKGTSAEVPWFVALSLESALTIAEANPDRRVFCAGHPENLANPPFKSNHTSLIICRDKQQTEEHIKQSALLLKEQGFTVYVVDPGKANNFNDLYRDQGKGAVKQQLEKRTLIATTKPKPLREDEQKLLEKAFQELAQLQKNMLAAKAKTQRAYQVQAQEALEKFAKRWSKEQPAIFKQLKKQHPALAKTLDVLAKEEHGREL